MTPVSAPLWEMQVSRVGTEARRHPSSTPGYQHPAQPSAPQPPRASPVLTLLTADGWHCREQAQNEQAEG